MSDVHRWRADLGAIDAGKCEDYFGSLGDGIRELFAEIDRLEPVVEAVEVWRRHGEANEGAIGIDAARSRIVELAQQYEAWCSGDGEPAAGVSILRDLCEAVRALDAEKRKAGTTEADGE